MAIPPFPSQDLAKLVLGYLAEEQLMTAYDEFLLASPYLDALRNEYDRIFMTSLKNILAEYRAVKIYVETCTPFLLRKKLFQCSNLLEIVKYLVSYVDINRLYAQETNTDKISSNKITQGRSSVCDVCNSLSLESCTCKAKCLKSVSAIHPASQIEASTLESSIETTSLSDLPGSSVTKKKAKDSVIETLPLQTNATEKVTENNLKNWNISSSTNNEPQLSSALPQDNTALNFNTQDVTTKSDESKQKIEEFNNILNLVCSNNNNNNNSPIPPTANSSSQDCINRTIGTFQEFATGVSGSSDKEKAIDPDSSTSEIFSIQNSRVENKININQITNIKSPPKAQFLLNIGTSITENILASKSNEPINTPKIDLIKIKSKQKLPEDQKVKILSDVKVDKSFKGNNNIKVPPPKPVTSTALFQMQTIVINGTPAYKHKPQTGTNFNYTKDEIMAMPTIILVPASGASQNTTVPPSLSSTAQSVNSSTTTTTSTARMLGPLLIDISSNSPTTVHSPKTIVETITQEASKVTSEVSSAQPIDITHSSVPKDTNLTVSNKTSTPHILPPTRKSSSTPRRTSHVRVLDFTTPRRILHETVNEQDLNKVMSQNIESDENTDFCLQDRVVNNDKIPTFKKVDSNTPIVNLSTKENSIKIKKNNWDAELRALAVRNDDNSEYTQKTKSKNTKIMKKNVTLKNENVKETSKSDKSINKNNRNKLSPKMKKSKRKIKSAKIVESVEEKKPEDQKAVECTVKPTVNIVKESDWQTMESKENTDNQEDLGKINYSDERVDTPENERLSLQNVIGAKLNISDLLETPYKQVLYDIQMETPKFLGPDLPDEPISDIKIMNIPTPRFLTTPKPLQATPSSYSSRPTDYSSGGSYYKPDDQDFIPTPEVLECAVSVVKKPNKDLKEKPKVTKVEMKEKSQKTSRPQRKCTKNVSYRSPNVTIRTKEIENQDIASVSSETSNTSSREKKADKSIEPRNRLKPKNKTDNKKKVTSTHKSPLKKETPKKYIRIKPFRKTPVKETLSKARKKTSDLLHTLSSKSLSRKRTSSKEKNTTIVPILNAVPTKSRRKSSTPRKLHCTKSFTSDSAEQNSSDLSKNAQEITGDSNAYCPLDSDTEQQPLRWSDDGSQDAKTKETQSTSNADNDDISKIKEYIETSVPEKTDSKNNIEGSLHIDLVKRGFDVETAKIIERDLLDTTSIQVTAVQSTNDITNFNRIEISKNVSDMVEADSSILNNLQTVQDEIDDEDFELSVYECDEETKNFVTCEFDESKFVPKTDISKLKDKFSMEICIEDGVSIRLRATPFQSIFEENSIELTKDYNPNETEAAVSSISNIDKLYTPMKDRRAQCYEIFDSTLTSIDTPLKTESVKESFYETTVTEIVLEVENIDVKDKSETKKRKRIQSGISDESLNKKTKPDTQYLLNSANIQNIDIESVLSKLHGP